jgi:hypothetical protein
MCQNDYLLTTAVLCQIHVPGYANGYNDINDLEIPPLQSQDE